MTAGMRPERRHMLARTGLAWLGMMQIMMLAFPGYLRGGARSAESQLALEQAIVLMNWLSLALCVPVVLYCAWPVWRGAWRDVARLRVGMDVPVALGILAAFIPSVYATWTNTGEVYFDSVSMFVAFLLTARYLETCARQAMAGQASGFDEASLLNTADRLAFWFVQQLPFPAMFAIGAWLPTIIPALGALVVVGLVGSTQSRAIRRSYMRNFTELGIPREIDALFEVMPEGLRLSTDRITLFPRWQAVDTVERHELGWVLSADQLTFLVPRDSFAGRDSERAFVAALVEQLSPGARDRSPEAVALAGCEPGVEMAEAAPAVPAASELPVAIAAVTAHEMSWAGRVGFDRIAHGERHTLLYPMLAAIVGGILGLVASGLLLVLLPPTITLGNAILFAGLTFMFALAGGVLGLWLGNRRLGTLHYKAYHAALAQRGAPTAADCEWTIDEDGLVTRSARGDSTTRWEAISEVFRADSYWIVLADLSANTIPRRAFADETAERAFIGALLDRLPKLARARSGDAAEFAAG